MPIFVNFGLLSTKWEFFKLWLCLRRRPSKARNTFGRAAITWYFRAKSSSFYFLLTFSLTFCRACLSCLQCSADHVVWIVASSCCRRLSVDTTSWKRNWPRWTGEFAGTTSCSAPRRNASWSAAAVAWVLPGYLTTLCSAQVTKYHGARISERSQGTSGHYILLNWYRLQFLLNVFSKWRLIHVSYFIRMPFRSSI